MRSRDLDIYGRILGIYAVTGLVTLHYGCRSLMDWKLTGKLNQYLDLYQYIFPVISMLLDSVTEKVFKT